MGGQNLYRFTVTAAGGADDADGGDGANAGGGAVLDEVSDRIGLRHLRQVPGTWECYVNGKRIFCRGPNYLSEQLQSNMTRAKYQADVRMMREANMNMVRVYCVVEKGGVLRRLRRAGHPGATRTSRCPGEDEQLQRPGAAVGAAGARHGQPALPSPVDRDTAQWSADSLGRSEVEEVAEGVSYGANTIRDGVSLTPRRELRALALPSEIMRLPNLEGYLKFPGPFPVASIRLKYVSRPKAAERFVPREDAAMPPGRADDSE